MMDNVISSFDKNKSITNADFSLRPTHDIDNPFAKISLNIIENLKNAITEKDKPILAEALLDEAKENLNFAYKIYSQIVEMTAEEEGLLFKARLIELLNNLENKYDDEYKQFIALFNFTHTLTSIIEQHIHNNKLKNAFIITLLLLETVEEMRIRDIHIPFKLEIRDYVINNHVIMMLVITAKIYKLNDNELNNFCINELLKYVNNFSHDDNVEICFDMLYFAGLLSNKENAELIRNVAKEIEGTSLYSDPALFYKYMELGITYSHEGSSALEYYVCKSIKNIHCITNIVNTCIIVEDLDCAEKILKFFIESKKISKHNKISLYQQLETVYISKQDEHQLAYIAKKRLELGDKNAYFDALKAFHSLGIYEKEKLELHNIACIQMPVYEYCCLLADNKEYDFLFERFNMLKSSKEISDAVKFMDDKGIALYDNDMNRKLLDILTEKSQNNKKLSTHIKSLSDLITI